MTFSTKASMWWGSVTTATENLFGKPKKKFTTHEYYDNPNPRSARPQSMHTVGSMRKASQRSTVRSNQGAQDVDDSQQQRGLDDGYNRGQGYQQDQDYPQEGGYGRGRNPNQAYPQGGGYPQQNYGYQGDQGY